MFAAEGVPSLSRASPAAAWVNAEPTLTETHSLAYCNSSTFK